MAMEAFDLAERFQTLVFVMSDLDLGMNTWMSAPFKYPEGRSIAARSWTRRRWHGSGSGDATRTWTATASRIARSLAPACRRTSRADRVTTSAGSTANGRTTTRTTWIGWRASSRPRAQYVPQPDRGRARRRADRDRRLRLQPLGDRREPGSDRGRGGLRTAYMRLRAYPFTEDVAAFIDRIRAHLRRRAEPRRADAGADAARTARRARRQAAKRPALQRPADRRALDHRRNPGPGRANAPSSSGRGGACWRGRTVGSTDRRSRWTRRHPHRARRPIASGSTSSRIAAARRRCAPAAATTPSPSESSTRSSRWAIDPRNVIKLSGIGCSSKSPAYFLGAAHGFNTVHGRMPSVGTGAMLANRKLMAIGVSGDGDTGAIGIGQFVHLMRRNVPIVYIIEDNGCYGLTKGQFSPTADVGSTLKTGVVNDLPPIDTLRAGDPARRHLRRALVLGRQEAAALDPEGVAQPSRHGADRRHLAVRHLQRSRGLDQELRLREGSRRAARRGELRPVLRGHHDRIRRRARPRK